MTQPDPTADFDGCRRTCRTAGAHTLVHGECEHAPEPEPTVSLSHVYTDLDRQKSIGFDRYTVQQLANLIEPALRRVTVRFGPNALGILERGETVGLSGGEYADLAREAAHTIVHRNDEDTPGTAAVAPPADRAGLCQRIADALLDHLSRTADIRPARDGQLAFMPEITDTERLRIAEHLASVLPAPDQQAAEIRAAAFLEVADRYALLADQNEAYDREQGELDETARLQHETVRDVAAVLRRLAGETQQDEAVAPASFVLWLDASDGSVPTHDGVRWTDGAATLHHRHFGYTTTHPDPDAARQAAHGKQGRIVWPTRETQQDDAWDLPDARPGTTDHPLQQRHARETQQDRCPSCGHKAEYHDVDNRCWFTVDHGLAGSNLVCPCAPRRDDGETQQDEPTAADVQHMLTRMRAITAQHSLDELLRLIAVWAASSEGRDVLLEDLTAAGYRLPHSCDNCDGIDPTSCLFNPDRPRTNLFAEFGVDTPGCDCGHDGMGSKWHARDCVWLAMMTVPHPDTLAREAQQGPASGGETSVKERHDDTGPVKGSTRRYAEELRSNPGTVVTDGHTGWECNAGASLIVEAGTPGPGKLGTHHGVIYACAGHRAAAVERITGAGYEVDPRPAPPGHRWDPWPCGHVTARDTEALTALTTAPTRSGQSQETQRDRKQP